MFDVYKRFNNFLQVLFRLILHKEESKVCILLQNSLHPIEKFRLCKFCLSKCRISSRKKKKNQMFIRKNFLPCRKILNQPEVFRLVCKKESICVIPGCF